MTRRTPSSTLFPSTTLFRSGSRPVSGRVVGGRHGDRGVPVPAGDAPDARERPRRADLRGASRGGRPRSEEHTSELQSRQYLVCRLLLEKKHTHTNNISFIFA